MPMNGTTVIFTFNDQYSAHSDIVDYYCDVNDDDEEVLFNVHVDDVDITLIKSMSDEKLCEHFGLDSKFLLYTNRRDLV